MRIGETTFRNKIQLCSNCEWLKWHREFTSHRPIQVELCVQATGLA